ncbi:hypothetical protein DL95DRAFT_460165 [Leptodontidium sp. 2 PMI_412]|nr:hypothetical protein DL95DRAFT_460165 [Leptodontidium sp. 2 PMI_412]
MEEVFATLFTSTDGCNHILQPPSNDQHPYQATIQWSPIRHPQPSNREINISLITFQDEVFDISNISIFGTVNDGSVNCTSPEPEAGDEVLVGPARVEQSVVVNVDTITVSLITFGDEVFDISNISILEM